MTARVTLLTALLSFPCFAKAQTQLTLDQAVASALARDERVRVDKVRVTQAERASGRALTIYGPRANVDATLILQRTIEIPGLGEFQPGQFFVLSGQITQPLYVHEYWHRRSASRHLRADAEETLERTRYFTEIDTIVAYYETLKSERRIELAKAATERASAQVVLARARVGAGAAMKTALLQAQIDLDRYNRQVLDAEGSQRVAREILSRLTGATLDVKLGEPVFTAPAVQNLEQARQKAFESRSDLKAAEHAVALAHSEVYASRSRLYPSLLGSFNYTLNEPAKPPFIPRDSWRATVTLNVPIFQSGAEYYDIKDKRSQLSQAEIRRDGLRKMINDETVRAWVALETATRQVELAERQLNFARENQQLVANQFRGGTATSTDATVAQATLNEAELNLMLATYDRQIAAAQVRFATGALLGK